jgi:hypothetical protein
VNAGVDLGFVGPKTFKILCFKEKNTQVDKLSIFVK